jgi:transposase InsO family protein
LESDIQQPQEAESIAECFGLDDDDLPADAFPLTYSTIAKHQLNDKPLLNQLKTHAEGYSLKSFRGGGKEKSLICRNGKIVIPPTLQQRTVEWYHTQLCHPGETRTEQTIRQHFWWKNLRHDVQTTCSKCYTCQLTKKQHRKYGKLPIKEAEAEPWDVLCVDLIGPYYIKRKGKSQLTLWAVTMIDPATSWFEITEIKTKDAATVANAVEQTWLTRYPWPTQIVYDKGPEFMAEFARMVTNDYGLKRRPISTRNPQANAILERVHQTIGNCIRTFQVAENYLDEDDPWSGILAATRFAIRATYHTTLSATPMQLVFGRDAILNVQFEADWRLIKERKQRLIRQNNARENRKRKDHTYKVNDKVLLQNDGTSGKFQGDAYLGPYTVMQVNDNGTVRLNRGAYIETVNIRRIKPFRE